jgi:hypothetical protein
MTATLTPKDPWAVFEYEADQFTSMLALLPSGNQEREAFPKPIQNAITESALLHARQLADIFLSRGTGSDDINLDDQLLKGYKPACFDELKKEYGDSNKKGDICWQLNKLLAHPTLNRGKCYDYTDLLEKLAPLLIDTIREVRAQHTAGEPPTNAKKPFVRLPPGLSAKTSS